MQSTFPNDPAATERMLGAAAARAARAERPDGGRRAFRPYPTPLFAEDGAFLGALNLFADLGDADHHAAQAERCRRLAAALTDRGTAEALGLLAQGHEEKAGLLRGSH